MGKLLGILPLFVALVLGLYLYVSRSSIVSETTINNTIEKTAMPSEGISRNEKMLFVPYWSASVKKEDVGAYDTLLYFGITANKQGIDTSDSGYKNMQQFISTVAKDKKKFLVVRLTDPSFNSSLLDNKILQETIAKQSVSVAKTYGFDGIVLDFELSVLSFNSVIKGITDFYTIFSTVVKRQKLPFFITIYGDTYYRFRPYQVAVLAKQADKVLVMTYDFHKANGNPGPNFPLSGKQTYGYDMEKMLDDFSKDVPKEKLTIVFGMFGYDWTIDKTGKSEKQAQSLSYLTAKQKFLDTCALNNCQIKQDSASAETTVTYQDDQKTSHVVWFETPSSAEQKQAFLKTKGINSFAFWAYSYF